MARTKLNKCKQSGTGFRPKKTAVLKQALKASHVTIDRKTHTTVESGAGQRQKSTYTFSSIFPNADIMNRAHKIISQEEFVK